MNFNKLKDETEFEEMVNNKEDEEVDIDLDDLKEALSNPIRDVQIAYVPGKDLFVVGQITNLGPVGTAQTLDKAVMEYINIQTAIVESVLHQQIENKTRNIKRVLNKESDQKEFI